MIDFFRGWVKREKAETSLMSDGCEDDCEERSKLPLNYCTKQKSTFRNVMANLQWIFRVFVNIWLLLGAF